VAVEEKKVVLILRGTRPQKVTGRMVVTPLIQSFTVSVVSFCMIDIDIVCFSSFGIA